jgi:hypothetical protein
MDNGNTMVELFSLEMLHKVAFQRIHHLAPNAGRSPGTALQ